MRDKTPIVAKRQTVPNTIRTNGPASERCGLGGSGGSGENGGVVIGFGAPGFGLPGFVGNGLDIFHLAGRGRLVWVLRCLRGRRRRNTRCNNLWTCRRKSLGESGRHARRQRADVPVR